MKKQRNMVIIFFGTVMLIALVLIGYLMLKSSNINLRLPGKKTGDLVDFPDNPKKGQPGYVETETTTSTTDEGRLAGNYTSIFEKSMIFNTDGDDTTVVLNDEVALQCTEETLAGLESVDLRKVKEVRIVTPEKLKTILVSGQPVFMIADQTSGSPRVHTIFVSADTCKKE